jgi:hypothetical protein
VTSSTTAMGTGGRLDGSPDAPGDAPGDAGGDAGACAHDPCSAGAPLDPSCDPGVATVCVEAPSCCTTAWTMSACAYNYAYTDAQGHSTTTMARCTACAGDCAHSLCIAGAAVDLECNLCSYLACQQKPACCLTAWDASCVALAQQECASAPACCF